MKIAYCLIVKDDTELPKLKKAVESAVGYVNSVHITANHDPHTEIEAWCSENGYDFSYLAWNDNFGEQRNFNFERAPQDTDFWLWADSDDYVIGADYIPGIAEIAKAQGHDVVFFDYWYGAKFDGEPSPQTFVENELVQKRERLINFRKVKWHKRIHETPMPLDGTNFKYTSVPHSKDYPVVWMHLGGDRDMGEERMLVKLNRNKSLLEKELADERSNGGTADPRTLLYLMKIYAELDLGEVLESCIELGNEYLSKSGWDQERSVCCELMAKCLGKLGKHEEAKRFLFQAIDEYPYNPLLHLYLARTYFNLGDFRAMEFWMKIGMNLEMDNTNSSMGNILELKVLSAELMLEFNLRGKKDIRKAYDAAILLNKVNPSENNANNEKFLKQMADLDIATEHAHKLLDWCQENKREDLIENIIENLPEEIKNLPFIVAYKNRYSTPKVWGRDEVCYFANFGQEHVEKWDGNSLTKGLGGSETAVIRLAEEWAKLGYKVTVYGDPAQEVEINGVKYVPFFRFNQKDLFNIFIQWRHGVLAGKVSCKKFYIDLHDVTHSSTFLELKNSIDKFFVKSNFHREMLKEFPDSQMAIISNGI
jgi:tetratricopeptide (TPR) repeat protein